MPKSNKIHYQTDKKSSSKKRTSASDTSVSSDEAKTKNEAKQDPLKGTRLLEYLGLGFCVIGFIDWLFWHTDNGWIWIISGLAALMSGVSIVGKNDKSARTKKSKKKKD